MDEFKNNKTTDRHDSGYPPSDRNAIASLSSSTHSFVRSDNGRRRRSVPRPWRVRRPLRARRPNVPLRFFRRPASGNYEVDAARRHERDCAAGPWESVWRARPHVGPYRGVRTKPSGLARWEKNQWNTTSRLRRRTSVSRTYP